LPNVKGNIACKVVIKLDKTERHLASISKNLEVIAHELKQMNKKPKSSVKQANSHREVKHKITK
jgi:hypothetical protein